MNLLSANDWHSLEVSLRKMNEITLTRSLGRISVEATTVRVNKAWPVAMLVGIRVESPQHGVQRQYFESVQAAQKAVETWKV